jgi:PAS domain S-box-containing protein
MTGLRDQGELLALHERVASEVVVAVDVNGVCEYVSPQAVALLGRHPAELIAHDGTEFVHPEDRDTVVDAAFGAASSGLGTATARVRHADGSWVWCNARVVASRGQDGDLVRFEATVRKATATDRTALHDDHGLCTAALLADRLSMCQGDWHRSRAAFSVIAVRIDATERAVQRSTVERVAKRLSAEVRSTDAVARTHRAGFTLVVRAPHEAADRVAQRIEAAMRTEVRPATVAIAVEHAIDAGGNGALMAARATRTVGLDPTP